MPKSKPLSSRKLASYFERADRETSFLNVDLELAGARPFPALVEALSSRLFEMFTGPLAGLHRAHYEVRGQTTDASATIRALVRVVSRLPAPALRQWNALRARSFNIGIQAGLEPRMHELAVDAKAVASVVAVGGEIVVTTYAPARREPRR